jgi:hypothetical protein
MNTNNELTATSREDHSLPNISPDLPQSPIIMASETAHDTHAPTTLQEKDMAEGDEKFENAAGMQSPASDEMTTKERAALTRRLLLKLDLRHVIANGLENHTDQRV